MNAAQDMNWKPHFVLLMLLTKHLLFWTMDSINGAVSWNEMECSSYIEFENGLFSFEISVLLAQCVVLPRKSLLLCFNYWYWPPVSSISYCVKKLNKLLGYFLLPLCIRVFVIKIYCVRNKSYKLMKLTIMQLLEPNIRIFILSRLSNVQVYSVVLTRFIDLSQWHYYWA